MKGSEKEEGMESFIMWMTCYWCLVAIHTRLAGNLLLFTVCCFTVLFFITNEFSLVCSIFSCCLYLSLQGVLNEIFNSGVCTGLLWKAVTVVALARNCTASPPSVITVVSYNVLIYQAWHSEPPVGSNSAIVTTQHLHVHLHTTLMQA